MGELRPSRPPGDRVGSMLGPYRILARLGAGGMGVVYRAEDTRLGRAVALKVLPEHVAADDDRRRRFEREARVAAGVNDPSIATVYDVGECDGRAYLAMELVEGVTLRQRFAKGRMPSAEALVVATAIARGLKRAHARGVVHRDLKPENVMLPADGGVKILDFGLAKLQDSASADAGLAHQETQTQEGLVLGTPGYMSPEQAAGLPVDTRSDVYAIGVMLHEMLTGELPSSFTPEGSIRGPSLVALLARCLSAAPGGRWRDAGALTDALEALDRAPAAPRWSLGRILGIAVAVAAVAAFAFGVTRRGDPPVEAPPAPAVSAAPGPTAVTDLPLPETAVPEARAEYAAALKAFRADGADIAVAHLRTATKLDATMAAAHLRLALLVGQSDEAGGHSELASAASQRARLTPRDQALLEAMEPVFGRAHKDYPLTRGRLKALSARYPLDVELLDWIGMMLTPGSDDDLVAARRATSLDPHDVQAWENVGTLLATRGKLDEAQAALEQGASLAVDTFDCLDWLHEVEAARGRCADAARDIRRVADGKHKPSLLVRAALLAGRPAKEVRDLIEQDVAGSAEADKALRRVKDDRIAAILEGHFDAARADLVREGAMMTASGELDYWDARFLATMSGLVALEVGDEAGARRAAMRFVDQSESLARPNGSTLGEADESGWLERLAAKDAEAWEPQRAAWLLARQAEGSMPALTWAYGWAITARTPPEATAAVAALDADAGMATPNGGEKILTSLDPDAHAGHVFLLASRPEEALPFLRRAASSCPTMTRGIDRVHAQLDLGRALEATSDAPGACDEYGKVLAAWGHATPRSVTADAARAGARRLHCPPAP